MMEFVELISPEFGMGDDLLVRQTFVLADAEIILEILIHEHQEYHLT
jgi:hypothetical protein